MTIFTSKKDTHNFSIKYMLNNLKIERLSTYSLHIPLKKNFTSCVKPETPLKVSSELTLI